MPSRIKVLAAIVGCLLTLGGWQASAQVDLEGAKQAADPNGQASKLGREASEDATGGSVGAAHNRRRRPAPRPRPRPAPAPAPAPETRVVFETPLQDPSNFIDEGVGIYSDPSTAMQLSTFTINKRMVSCGVGTFAAAAANSTGPFAMLMYSTKIDSYTVNKAAGTITATGRMRSITAMGDTSLNNPTEDVEHDFIAVAEKGGMAFATHFRTPFWNQQSNPMCTPSSLISGGCRFGGKVQMGTINL